MCTSKVVAPSWGAAKTAYAAMGVPLTVFVSTSSELNFELFVPFTTS